MITLYEDMVLFVGMWYKQFYIRSNVAVPLTEPRSKPDPLDQARPDQQRGMRVLQIIAGHQQNRAKAAFRESDEDVALYQALP